MASATFAKGYYVYIDDVRINKILEDGIPQPEVSDEEIDATTMDSGDWEETIAGRKTGGTVTLRCLYDGDSQGQEDLEDAWAENPKQNHTFKVVLPNNITTMTYEGWVKSFKNPVIDKKVGIEAVIRVTGQVTRSTTDAALTTPYMVISGLGTVMVPVAGAAGGTRVVNIGTDITEVTLTPTSAAGTITVNGVAVTSGAASAAVTLGAKGSITEAIVKVSETGKTTTVYRYLLCRASA